MGPVFRPLASGKSAPLRQARFRSAPALTTSVAKNLANSTEAVGQARVRVRIRRALAAVLGMAALFGGCAPIGLALEPTTPLASYGRQAWGMENGLPQNTVQALAQTADGFVWLGTEVGLVRFDGNGFQVFDKNTVPALPGNDVRCLLAEKDGSLWIGTSEGLARWKDGAVTAYGVSEGLPGNLTLGIVRDEDGKLWVQTNQGPAYLSGGRFTAQYTFNATSQTLGRMLAGDSGFMRALPGANIQVWGSRNVLVLTDMRNPSRSLAELRVGHELPGSKIQTVFVDSQEGLWIGTNGGLARWVDGKLQRLPVTDPLAKASVLALMEDREGNIWVGTEADGLHILRDQRFRTIGAREGLTSDATTTVVEDAKGKLWVGTNGGGLNSVPRGGNDAAGKQTYSVRDVLLSDVILSLAAAPNGDLWVGTPDGLNRIRGSAVDSFTSADGLPDDFIRSLLVDMDGSLWIGTRRGLTHWLNAGAANAHMETYTHANGLGSDLVGAMTRDAHGDLWVATLAGISRLHAGKIENFTTANGLSSNVITALLARADGTLLIGTQDHGWNLWNGKSFSAANNGLDQTTIHAILDDGLGHLWFATGKGIARCDCNAMSGTAGCSRWIEFGSADGLRSRETATNSHPSAWRSRDGRLWFATPKGLVEVDPAHFPVNAVPPGVALERFAIDDVPETLHAADPRRGADLSVQIPAGHVHFEFDYAGLSFVAPQKVRYRYMLENFDKGWTDAGSRRTAYYTNIPAGRYTFRVQAANNDGVWNDQGAALTFVLRPHFYQTLWFYALLILLLVGLIVLVQRLRLNRAEREFNAVLAERNRIAREIHDTLAQGYVGISVQLEVLAELLRMSKLEAAQKHLDLTRGYVREGLADARQSIWALRSQDSGETTLPVRLRRIVEAEGNHGLESSFSIFGAYRPLPPGTEQEILRVAQEAIHNVKKHSEAGHLFVQLEYGPAEIQLEVRDDGRGFAVAAAPAPGHYGLTGMRERAAAVGGALEVTSEPGAGTTVRLRVKARLETREHKEQP
jgi:signal transduction histidine kinase/ligand-binding sensor domain-containing protein